MEKQHGIDHPNHQDPGIQCDPCWHRLPSFLNHCDLLASGFSSSCGYMVCMWFPGSVSSAQGRSRQRPLAEHLPCADSGVAGRTQAPSQPLNSWPPWLASRRTGPAHTEEDKAGALKAESGQALQAEAPHHSKPLSSLWPFWLEGCGLLCAEMEGTRCSGPALPLCPWTPG